MHNYLQTHETALSRYIAMLLNPQAEHAQAELYLALWLRQFDLTHFDAKQCRRVEVERRTASGRFLDIYLEFEDGVIGIENKPWAIDQTDQLHDYADYLQRQAHGKPWLLIYLGNSEPAEQSLTKLRREQLEASGNFLMLSFYEVVQWLMEAARHSRPQQVRLFIETLVDFINVNINGEGKMNNMDQFKQVILAKPEAVVAAFDVVAALKMVKAELLARFEDALNAEINECGKPQQWRLIFKKEELLAEKRWSAFGIQLHPDHKYYLCFHFEFGSLHGLEWGICRIERDLVQDKTVVKPIFDVLAEKFNTGVIGMPAWPWYMRRSVDTFLKSEEHNWATNAAPWLRLERGVPDSLPERIVQLAHEIDQALAPIHHVMCLSGLSEPLTH